MVDLDDELELLASVDDAVRRAAGRWGSRTWVVADGGRRTFAEADDVAARVASGLARLGVRPGDRVAVVSPNRIEVLDLLVGASARGAVQVPLNVYLRGDGLAHQLADAGARVVVADRAGVDAVLGLADGLPDLEVVVALDEVPPHCGVVEVVHWSHVGECAGDPVDRIPCGRGDLQSIVYTSGTTGRPRGVMLPHGYALASSTDGGALQGYGPDDVVLTALPLYHGFARGAVTSALLHGATAVVESAFSPAPFLARAREVGATVLQLVGAMAPALLALPPDAGDAGPQLRMATAMPLAPERAAELASRLGAVIQTAVYGQTETGGICLSPPGEPTPPGTLGRPAPNFEVALVDPDDLPVADGEVGEVVVRPRRPHSMSQGYWQDPAATARSWRNLWHHTGDLARRSPDGTLTFVDRRSDAIRRRGENIASASVEDAVLAHPAVAEAAAHAVPAAEGEDDVKVCLVLEPGATVTPEEVFATARDRLPYFAVPRYVEVVDELPRTVTMRVRRHLLRDRGVTAGTWDLHALGLEVARDERR